MLEAELGARLTIRDQARALEAELVAAQRHVAALEAEVTPLRERSDALEAEAALLRMRYDGSERALQNITGSASWRMTEPLRSAKRLARLRSR